MTDGLFSSCDFCRVLSVTIIRESKAFLPIIGPVRSQMPLIHWFYSEVGMLSSFEGWSSRCYKKSIAATGNWSFGWGTDLRFKLCLCSLLNPTENLGLYSNLSCIQITKAHYSFYLHRSHDEWQVCPLHSALFYSLNSCWVAAKSHVWEMLLIASEPLGATSLLKSKPSAHISFIFFFFFIAEVANSHLIWESDAVSHCLP